MSRNLVGQSSNAGAQSPESGDAEIHESDTGFSLQRLERERKSRPCFLSIDLRTCSAGRCQQYEFNDRVHYLDPESRELFEQGLSRYNGVYTVGTYEEIVSRACDVPLTGAAMPDRQSRAPVDPPGMAAGVVDGAGDGLHALAGEGQNPARLRLGYFRRRSEPRLTYATLLAVCIEGETMAGVSRDISVNGLQLELHGHPGIEPGCEIRIGFEELARLQDAPDLAEVGYELVKVRRRDSGTLLHLHLRRAPAADADEVACFLAGFIERYRHRYKLDVDDEYRSVFSWLYERSYAEHTSTVPLFIERGEDRQLCLQAVAMSCGNAHLLRYFCTGDDSYNFTPLCPPQRLARLEQGRAYTLAMYRHRGERDEGMRIHSLADFECGRRMQFAAVLAFVLGQPEHCIVRVVPGAARLMDVPGAKIDEVSRRLQEKSPMDTRELRQRLDRLQLLACMSDVTADMQYSLAPASVPEEDISGLSVWVGGERRSLGSGVVEQRLTARRSLLSPELIRFGYVERRREDRYLVEIAVEVRAGERRFAGMTRDISCRGMCVRLRGDVHIARRELVKLSLTMLQKRVDLDLTGIPYRVVDVRRCEDNSLLMLERVADSHHAGLSAFLTELISRNRHKLKVDVGDIHSAAVSRIYESLLAANTPCLPVFIGASEEGGVHLQFVGLPQGGNSLAGFFAAGGEPDFSALNEGRFVTAIHDALQIVSRQTGHTGVRPAPFELEAYFYREPVEKAGDTAIRMHTELDFSDHSERRDFEAWLAERGDWRKVRVLATSTGSLDADDLESMIMPLRQQSRHKATRLSDLLHSLVGYAELIDITPGENHGG